MKTQKMKQLGCPRRVETKQNPWAFSVPPVAPYPLIYGTMEGSTGRYSRNL